MDSSSTVVAWASRLLSEALPIEGIEIGIVGEITSAMSWHWLTVNVEFAFGVESAISISVQRFRPTNSLGWSFKDLPYVFCLLRCLCGAGIGVYGGLTWCSEKPYASVWPKIWDRIWDFEVLASEGDCPHLTRKHRVLRSSCRLWQAKVDKTILRVMFVKFACSKLSTYWCIPRYHGVL